MRIWGAAGSSAIGILCAFVLPGCGGGGGYGGGGSMMPPASVSVTVNPTAIAQGRARRSPGQRPTARLAPRAAHGAVRRAPRAARP